MPSAKRFVLLHTGEMRVTRQRSAPGKGLPICSLLGVDCAANSQRLTLALQETELYKYAGGDECLAEV